MGALHPGHGSLVRVSASEHPVTVVSIFVNPTQFGVNEDFTTYPRTFQEDVALAASFGATHIFAPTADEMYPAGFSTSVSTGHLSTILEGARRPGHFDGVATVVCKLFSAIMPHVAYFGQKDYQQTLVVRRLITDLNLRINLNVVPTVREPDGLAMSSRNRYLSPVERKSATVLYRALMAGASVVKRGSGVRAEIEAAMTAELIGFDVDYATAAQASTLEQPSVFRAPDTIVLLLAVRIGKTRLIDNVVVPLGDDNLRSHNVL